MEKHLKILGEFFKTFFTQMNILLGTSQNEVTQGKSERTCLKWQLFLHNGITLWIGFTKHPWRPCSVHFLKNIFKIRNTFLERTQKCLMFYWLHLGSLSLKHWGVGLITLVQTNQSLSSQERIHTSWNMGPHRRWASERICQQ